MEQQQVIITPRSVVALRGAEWLFDGFGYFKSNPLAWIGSCFIFLLITLAIGSIPIIWGLPVYLLVYVFEGGFMLGCQAVDANDRFRFHHLFAGFKHDRVGQLVMVGALFVIGYILLMALVLLMFYIQFGGEMVLALWSDQYQESAPVLAGIADNLPGLLLCILVGLAFSLPLIMAFWFAPAIIVLRQINAIPAMILSFKACLVNILPFLVYGIVGLILFVLATIPVMLGHLVLFPMIIASIYIGYKDVLSI